MAEIDLRFPSRKDRQPFEELRCLFPDLADVALDAVIASPKASVLDEVLVDALGRKALRQTGLDAAEMWDQGGIAGWWKRG